MKTHRSVTRDQLVLAMVLGGLFLLGLILWVVDSTHQPVGPSRFVGPSTAPAKP